MTRSTNRRAAATLAGTALAAGLLLAGCSAGQIAETARKNPSVQGINADAQIRDGKGALVGSVAVRDVTIAYAGPQGYDRGADAPLDVRIFNDTRQPVTVQVSTARPAEESGEIVEAESVVLLGGDEPTAAPTAAEPTATVSGTPGAPPTAAPGAAARLEIPAGGFVVLNRETGRYLSLTGLSGRLVAGMSVPLVFEFSGGALTDTVELPVTAPVSTPLTEVPRATPEPEEAEGGH